MSTLDTFKKMTGINETFELEISPERAREIIQTVTLTVREDASATVVNLLPVSSYVSQGKPSAFSVANIVPSQPPFSAHWGIVVGVSALARTAMLLHLVLEEDEDGNRRIAFAMTNVGLESKAIKGAEVKEVGHTKFSVMELIRIGEEMIKTFGNHHLIFWNCQMFAKCYLRVITGSDAAFLHWTSADVTNLFLCAFVISAPISSTSKSKEQHRTKRLQRIGAEVAMSQTGIEADREEDLFEASDRAIDVMKEATKDEEAFKELSRLVKDSSDKRGVIRNLRSFWSQIRGS